MLGHERYRIFFAGLATVHITCHLGQSGIFHQHFLVEAFFGGSRTHHDTYFGITIGTAVFSGRKVEGIVTATIKVHLGEHQIAVLVDTTPVRMIDPLG